MLGRMRTSSRQPDGAQVDPVDPSTTPVPTEAAPRLEDTVAEQLTIQERVAMGERCRDCDPVPKVDGAGRVETDADGRRVQLMHNGLRVLADGYYGAWMTDLIQRCRGHHEPQEERAFHEVVSRLPADATMLEMGGFWAYYSLWFLQGQPQRRSLVMEPDPAHIVVGETNAALNGLAPVFMQGFAGEAGPPRPFQTEESGIIDMPCLSVPQIMATHGLDHLTLLHCDAQGAELATLQACRDLFRAGGIDWVFVSTHAHQISGDPLMHQRCLAELQACGATIEVEHDVHESFSGDGLIVARFVPAPPDWPGLHLSYNRYSTSLFRNPVYDLAAATTAP